MQIPPQVGLWISELSQSNTALVKGAKTRNTILVGSARVYVFVSAFVLSPPPALSCPASMQLLKTTLHLERLSHANTAQVGFADIRVVSGKYRLSKGAKHVTLYWLVMPVCMF